MIVNTFKDIVEGLNDEIKITSKETVLDGKCKINLLCTKWVRDSLEGGLNSKVEIGGIIYEVVEVGYNSFIRVKTTSLPSGNTVKIAAPLYINATMLAANHERENILKSDGSLAKDSYDKLPFVWLLEPFTSIEDKNRLSIIDSTNELVFLFLDGRNKDWLTNQNYSNVITPLDDLVDSFYYAIKNKRDVFGKVTNFRKIRHAKFGEAFKQGSLQSILNENLGGIEVRLSVEILKNLNCKNCN